MIENMSDFNKRSLWLKTYQISIKEFMIKNMSDFKKEFMIENL